MTNENEECIIRSIIPGLVQLAEETDKGCREQGLVRPHELPEEERLERLELHHQELMDKKEKLMQEIDAICEENGCENWLRTDPEGPAPDCFRPIEKDGKYSYHPDYMRIGRIRANIMACDLCSVQPMWI
jgi:hypothetical protein|tara:strand:+ start:782 stop:1171 length:390 start_codon:yes stop_codon:yes gene_type:complete